MSISCSLVRGLLKSHNSACFESGARSAGIIRVSNTAKFTVALVLAVFLSLAAYGQKCGSVSGKPTNRTTQVSLLPKPTTSEFYYRLDDFIVFIPAETVLDAMNVDQSAGDAAIQRLRPLILAQMPLKDDKDLFLFNLDDWLFYSSIKSIVKFAIEHGDASITDLSRVWFEKATVVHTETSLRSDTGIFVGRGNKNKIFSILECIAN